MFAGRISKGPSPYFITREPLFQGDLLRLGYEDDKGHAIQRVNRSVPKKGKFVLKKNRNLAKGAPVFIVDRREPEVKALIKELALGIVVKGNWPLCISRTLSPDIRLNNLFSSPMGEKSWVSKRDDNFWVFPEWELDLTSKRKELQNAGYQIFVSMQEPVPKGVFMKKRPGLWNWKMSVL